MSGVSETMGLGMGKKLCSLTSISQNCEPYHLPQPIETTIIVLVQGSLQQSCDCGSKEFRRLLFYYSGFKMKSNIIKAVCHTNIRFYIDF